MHSIIALVILGLSGLTFGIAAVPNYTIARPDPKYTVYTGYTVATAATAVIIQTPHPLPAQHSTTTKVIIHTFYANPTAAPARLRTAKRINREAAKEKRADVAGRIPGTGFEELDSTPVNPEATEAGGDGVFAPLTLDMDLAPRDDCKWVCSGNSCDCIQVAGASSAGVSSKFLGAMAVFAVAVAAGGIA